MDKPSDKPNCCQGVDGPCENNATWRRQDTAYFDEIKNWVNMCDRCFEVNKENWDSMRADLYSGLIDL